LMKVPRERRRFLQVFVTALLSYYLAFVGADIGRALDQPDGRVRLLIGFGASIVIVVILTLLSSFLETIVEGVINKRRQVLADANAQVSQCITEKAVRSEAAYSGQAVQMVAVSDDPLRSIQDLVRAAYRVLDAQYADADGAVPGERISFETTFMAAEDDGHVTILGWANHEGVRPASLNAREHDATVYDRSVTADIYRQAQTARPTTRIIEDTADPSENYAELYAGQKARIRSSIVAPVLAPHGNLVGTLVLHCNRPRFFLRGEEGFWSEFVGVFAPRLTLEKMRLDRHGSENAGQDAVGGPRAIAASAEVQTKAEPSVGQQQLEPPPADRER
jgi:hypothetical protein